MNIKKMLLTAAMLAVAGVAHAQSKLSGRT